VDIRFEPSTADIAGVSGYRTPLGEEIASLRRDPIAPARGGY
jgi:hypothetical protein